MREGGDREDMEASRGGGFSWYYKVLVVGEDVHGWAAALSALKKSTGMDYSCAGRSDALRAAAVRLQFAAPRNQEAERRSCFTR